MANANGKVLLNGPFANTLDDTFSCFFGLIIIAAIFGTSILRDFQRDTYQMLFTKPISKLAYLGGRWAGSFVTTVVVFSGLMAGTYVGTFAPWADHARIGPNVAAWYLQPFFSIVVIQIFFMGTLFFAIAALTRKIFIVYLQGVALFMLYIIGLTVFSATRSLEHFWSGILDPVGLRMVDAITRYWSVVERNTLLLPWDFSGYSPGVFLYNRLLWTGVGLAALVGVWALFPMSVEVLTARSQGKRAAKARLQDTDEPRPIRSLVTVRLPRVSQVFGARTTLLQYLTLTRLRIRNVTREIPFWAIVGLLIVFSINNGHFAGRVGGVNVWPVTYLMVQAVEGSATLFFIIVAALYAAELIWRERDTRFDGIHDALPMAEWIDWLSKFTAIAAIEIALLVITMLVGMLMQTIDGYYHYEVLQYVQELFVITLPQMLAYALLAMFVQTMVANKFIGHGIVIGVVVLQPILFNFGWENTLYLPGGTPVYTYSDMNGYGHYVRRCSGRLPIGFPSLRCSRWFPLPTVGGVRMCRWRPARVWRCSGPPPAPAAALFLPLALGSGLWYFYNAHVLNEFLTPIAAYPCRLRAALQTFENIPQPKITAVEADINIYPERRGFDGTPIHAAEQECVPISEIHRPTRMKRSPACNLTGRSIWSARTPRSLFHLCS